jgi:predicted dehydrogenase
MTCSRRTFLTLTALSSTGAGLLCPTAAAIAAQPRRTYRAAVIGRTGGGDFGHGYDQIFQNLDGVTVEAVADQDTAGLKAAAARSGARHSYLDYKQMLRTEKPDLVSIAPRQPDCHVEMCLAAVEVCRGIFIEKPFTETPAAADTILAAADKRGVKIQVAHNRRYTSEFVRAGALLRQGLIGQVRMVQMHGKQDGRAGGEDMLVLGTHDFDLMRSYFGNPLWCQASVTAAGHPITRADVVKGREPILVAGDTIHAQFAFPANVMVHWNSVKTADHWNTSFSRRDKWAFEILGTKGILAYQSGGSFVWLNSPFFTSQDDGVGWQPLPQPANWEWPEEARHPIRSLVHAIETGGQPVCSGSDGRWAVEMVAAVYESERSQSRVSFPLRDRGNPLLKF